MNTDHEPGPLKENGSPPASECPHRVVIVGGGAAGIELATALGRKLGRKRKAQIILIDRERTHLWKPKLHEVAAGSMDLDLHRIDYIVQAHWMHFQFRLGEMIGLDRARRVVHLASYLDEEGRQVTPPRSIGYDTLIIAVGSLTNDFGTPGVTDHALRLETAADAERFQQRMVNACIRVNAQTEPRRPEQLQVAIVGAGATGVELAAELHRTTREVVAFGLDRIDPGKDIKVHLIEAAERILPALPERLSAATAHLLGRLGVQVHVNARVAEVIENGVKLADGKVIPAELTVWAAGVKAPGFLEQIDGLETNRINQLVVEQTLRTTRDANIFAIGDCAACPWPEKQGTVPPRAQAAHQQATHMVRQVHARMRGTPLKPYHYRDFGSLISLGHYSTIGSMMGGLSKGSLFIEGHFARMMYLSLYKMHQVAVHGFVKTALGTLARVLTRRTESHVKLH